jgi:hypothetical protein
LSSVSGNTYTWKLGPIVWSQGHGLGGAITITVTASNAGGTTSNSATVTLAECQESPPLPPPVITLQDSSGSQISQVDSSGLFICPSASSISIFAAITGASSVSASYTVARDGATGPVSFVSNGNSYKFVVGPIPFNSGNTDPTSNLGSVTLTITATNSQGRQATASVPNLQLLGCSPIPR